MIVRLILLKFYLAELPIRFCLYKVNERVSSILKSHDFKMNELKKSRFIFYVKKLLCEDPKKEEVCRPLLFLLQKNI